MGRQEQEPKEEDQTQPQPEPQPEPQEQKQAEQEQEQEEEQEEQEAADYSSPLDVPKPEGVLRHLRAHTAHTPADGRYLPLAPGTLIAETAVLPNGWSEGFLLDDPTHTARHFPVTSSIGPELWPAFPPMI